MQHICHWPLQFINLAALFATSETWGKNTLRWLPRCIKQTPPMRDAAPCATVESCAPHSVCISLRASAKVVHLLSEITHVHRAGSCKLTTPDVSQRVPASGGCANRKSACALMAAGISYSSRNGRLTWQTLAISLVQHALAPHGRDSEPFKLTSLTVKLQLHNPSYQSSPKYLASKLCAGVLGPAQMPFFLDSPKAVDALDSFHHLAQGLRNQGLTIVTCQKSGVPFVDGVNPA